MEFNIHTYLKKFKNLTPSDRFIKENLIKVVDEVISIKLENKNISIQSSVIFLSIHPMEKHTILLNKKQILDVLHTNISNKFYIKDIR